MSGSLPGTWTGTDTPGEMSPAEMELGNKKKEGNAVKRQVFSYLLFLKCHQKATCYYGQTNAACTVSVGRCGSSAGLQTGGGGESPRNQETRQRHQLQLRKWHLNTESTTANESN